MTCFGFSFLILNFLCTGKSRTSPSPDEQNMTVVDASPSPVVSGGLKQPKLSIVPIPTLFVSTTEVTNGPGHINGQPPPSEPLNLRSTAVTSRSATLTWETPLQANGEIVTYSIYYKNDKSSRSVFN